MPTSRSLWSPALLAAACALSAHSQAAGAPDMLRVALHADIASVNPGVNRDGNSDMVMAHVVEGLVAYGEDLSIKPMLASSWTASEDSTSYEFKLRPNVRFHNGKTLSAADVVWNFKRYLDPKTNFQCINRYNGSSFTDLRANLQGTWGGYYTVNSITEDGTYFWVGGNSAQLANYLALVNIFQSYSSLAAGVFGTRHILSVRWSLTRDATAPAFLREVPRLVGAAGDDPMTAERDPT